MTYEYKEVTLVRGALDQLNYLGEEGWQVVSAEYDRMTTNFMLMREVKPAISQPVHYSIEDTPLRQIEWQVYRKGRGYPQYNLTCECGWTHHHPSAVVSKQAADEHKCYPMLCNHGLTPAMGCCVCTDEDYHYSILGPAPRTSKGVTDCEHTNVGLCNDCMKDT